MSLILASASPRRKELLKNITEDFKIIVAKTDETLDEKIAPKDVPEFLATKKARAVREMNPNDTVIGSDTIVLLGDKILGKPVSREDAFNMLKELSGNVHSVITGCCICEGEKEITFSCETKVEFFPLTNEEIYAYLDTNEPYDKAGSYGIQGVGSLFVKEIMGDYFNVVGLPVSMLNKVLKENKLI